MQVIWPQPMPMCSCRTSVSVAWNLFRTFTSKSVNRHVTTINRPYAMQLAGAGDGETHGLLDIVRHVRKFADGPDNADRVTRKLNNKWCVSVSGILSGHIIINSP